MRVVSLPQPAATLTITRQPHDDPCWRLEDVCSVLHPMVSRWVTFDYACPSEVVGTRIAIAAKAQHVEHCSQVGSFDVLRQADGDRMVDRYTGRWVELPLGVVVGSAIIEASYPIVGENEGTPDGWPIDWPLIERTEGHLTIYANDDPDDPREPIDITDQLPYCDWSPGRFAWLLTDAEALPEPVRWVSSGGRLPEWQPT